MANQLSLFCTDYFFHYLLIHSPKARVCIASHLSGQKSKYAEIISSERYPGHKDGKKFILDITMKDDLGHLYNLEMQNGYISKSELARFQIYAVSMIDLQIQEGAEYEDMKKVHSLIIYTGNPIYNFEHLWHEVELMDGKYKETMYNGLIRMNFLQLKRMEELGMEVIRSDFYELMRLFEKEENHEKEQESEVAKEAVDIYKRYLTMEEYIVYKEIQRDRLWAKTEINRGIKRGRAEGLEAGKMEERVNMVRELIKMKYSIDPIHWISQCTYHQLELATRLFMEDLNYEELKARILYADK